MSHQPEKGDKNTFLISILVVKLQTQIYKNIIFFPPLNWQSCQFNCRWDKTVLQASGRAPCLKELLYITCKCVFFVPVGLPAVWFQVWGSKWFPGPLLEGWRHAPGARAAWRKGRWLSDTLPVKYTARMWPQQQGGREIMRNLMFTNQKEIFSNISYQISGKFYDMSIKRSILTM